MRAQPRRGDSVGHGYPIRTLLTAALALGVLIVAPTIVAVLACLGACAAAERTIEART